MKNFKVTIQNVKDESRTWVGFFDTEQEANLWLAAQKLKEGRLDIREVVEFEGLDENDVLSQRFEDVQTGLVDENDLPILQQIRYVTLVPEASYSGPEDISRAAKLDMIKAKQKDLLDEADIMLNKAQDGESGPSVSAIRTYRSAIRAVNNFFQDNEEDLDDLVVADYIWPAKP